jgi:hypothetical protein
MCHYILTGKEIMATRMHSKLLQNCYFVFIFSLFAVPSSLAKGDNPQCFSTHPWRIKPTFVESLRRHLLENCKYSALFDVTVHKHVQRCVALRKYTCNVTIHNCLHQFCKMRFDCPASVSWNQ